MDQFQKAKTVRLKSAHNKYLIADEDEESVIQGRNGSSSEARWAVEFVENSVNIIRLRSCYGKYLMASNEPFWLGTSGRKVLQTLQKRLDSSVEWEPVWENGAVKLKTRHGWFLRANGGLPPWRNSVTHGVPHRKATKEWVLWEVHVVDILPAVVAPLRPAVVAPLRPAVVAPLRPPVVVGWEEVLESEMRNDVSGGGYYSPASFSKEESNDDYYVNSFLKGSDGRLIYFRIADENGQIDEGFEELCITFKGNEVNELTLRLEEELGLDGITVCARSPLNGKLYPLSLQLPPNNTAMHVVVIPSSS